MPQGPQVCAKSGAANVQSEDPNHSVSGVTFQIFGDYHPDETAPEAEVMKAQTMLGFLQEEENVLRSTNLSLAGENVKYLSEEDIPVYRTMAENFVLFDRWFADVPGPTDPNRYKFQSGNFT